jgi:hypothetical protein
MQPSRFSVPQTLPKNRFSAVILMALNSQEGRHEDIAVLDDRCYKFPPVSHLRVVFRDPTFCFHCEVEGVDCAPRQAYNVSVALRALRAVGMGMGKLASASMVRPLHKDWSNRFRPVSAKRAYVRGVL